MNEGKGKYPKREREKGLSLKLQLKPGVVVVNCFVSEDEQYYHNT